MSTRASLNGVVIAVLISTPILSTSSVGQETEQDYARTPKAIAFQNDSQWEDNRWQQSDIGPFLSGTIAAGKGLTLKGIAIRIGDRGQAAVCFDSARMRYSAAWKGEFLRFEARRFGLIRPPRAAGEVFFATPKLAGWSRDGRFQPEPSEITDVNVTGIPSATSETRLPKDWAHYKGLYTSDDRIVLSYTVGSSAVLDSPWYDEFGDERVFIRSLEIGPSTDVVEMLAADGASRIALAGNPTGVTIDQDRSVLKIAAHDRTLRLRVLIMRPDIDDAAVERIRRSVGDTENLTKLVSQDCGRFRQVLSTKGVTTDTGGPYVIDTLTLPFDNPWKALMFTAGHDFFSDGTAAVCTIQGDVWTVSGIDRHLRSIRWRRFATGLCQPLGLKIVDDKVYVIGRNQITRLHDRNGDGEADYHENFNNDMIVSPRSHDYVTCLDTDPDGNFYFIHAATGVMRVSADGSSLSMVADGFRNPNGMAVGPQGMITAAPQQGTWTPESSLIVVKPGGYYGYGGPRVTPERPTGWDLPMCFIPRAMDNSGGAQVWVEGKRWGPLVGKMLHLSFGQCRMLLALTEEVDGTFQGGTIRFPTTPVDFESGIMRGRFNPHDGQLYVTGLRGWQTRAIRDGCLQRVRYTGGPLHLPTAIKTYTNGMKVTFSEKLDPEFAENPDNYFVEQWNYLWSKEYGSADYSVSNAKEQGRDEVPVVSSTLIDDGRSVFLEMPGRHPVNQISISWLLRSANTRDVNGQRFRGTFAHTINVEPREAFPDSQIVRRPRPTRIASEIEQRLKPGLEFRLRVDGGESADSRIARMVALHQPIESSVTPFLPPGPFSLEATGTLQTSLSGFYDFRLEGSRLEGSGAAQLWINGQLVLDQATSAETSDSLLLHKGHNPIRVRFESPPDGVADLRLLWKGHDFGWEPVPPDVFFHDSGAETIVEAQRRRLGRQLFAEHRCAACHRTEGQAMFEVSLAAPDLKTAGDRFNPQWLRQWILSPRSLRPDSRMPAVLGEGAQAEIDAADIEAYLSGLSEGIDPPKAGGADDAKREGATLYEQLGCIACHHFESPDRADEFDRLSLQNVNEKFRPGALSGFLKRPSEFHDGTRMGDFRLDDREADSLAMYVRSEAKRLIAANQTHTGDAARGQTLFRQKGCANCHAIGLDNPIEPAQLRWNGPTPSHGCLAISPREPAPEYRFTEEQRRALDAFISHDLSSLSRDVSAETSARLTKTLRCTSCHDRDHQRSPRALLMAEEGSGAAIEVLPSLTWAGEKLQPRWTDALLSGELDYKSRPWIQSRMPAFPAYAGAISHGLAAEHGIDPHEQTSHSGDEDLAKIGEQLTLQSGLDCRQCHAIGDQQPRGDKDTKVALGINFSFIRERMRRDSYDRFMMDPPRYDTGTRMIRLSEDGVTTKLKSFFDADARKQFDAVWHYLQSVPDADEMKKPSE